MIHFKTKLINSGGGGGTVVMLWQDINSGSDLKSSFSVMRSTLQFRKIICIFIRSSNQLSNIDIISIIILLLLMVLTCSTNVNSGILIINCLLLAKPCAAHCIEILLFTLHISIQRGTLTPVLQMRKVRQK